MELKQLTTSCHGQEQREEIVPLLSAYPVNFPLPACLELKIVTLTVSRVTSINNEDTSTDMAVDQPDKNSSSAEALR